MTPDEVAKELLRLEADRSLTDAQFLVAAKKVVQDFLNPVRSSGGDCTASLRDIPGWKEFVERNVDRVLAVTPEQQRAARKLLIDKAPVAEITLVTGNQEREEAMDKPVCKLVGTDGNVFSIIGAVSKTLKRAGQPEKAKEFQNKAFSSGSYDAVLQLCMEYVEVE